MKNHKIALKKKLASLTAALLISSSSAMSAVYNPFELPQTDSTGMDINKSFNNELENSPSFLNSLQQGEINQGKTQYVEALNLIKQNKLKEAKDKISALLKEAPEDPNYYNLQAILEIYNKNILAAQQSFNKAIEMDPNNIESRRGLAKIYLDLNEYSKAQEQASKILNISDRNIDAFLILAAISYKQKQYDEVESILLSADEKVKDDPNSEARIIDNLAILYSIEKQPEKLLSLAEVFYKRHPNDSRALLALANAQIVNNKKDLAEANLRQLINREKKNINIRLLLAKLLSQKQNNEKETLQLLDEAAAIDPNNPQPIAFKAVYLIQLQRFHEALELSNKIGKQFPKLALSNLVKGNIYLAEKKLDDALDNFRQAYKIQQNNIILFLIVDILDEQKKQSEAIILLNKELEKSPKNSDILLKLGTIYEQLNDYKQAENYYLAVLAQQPENSAVLNNLAWIYAQQNNPKALELAKKAYDLAPHSASIADTYGYILIKNGQLADGLTVLEKASDLEPGNNDIQLHLAEAYAANNNNDKAIELLEKLTKAEQTFPGQKTAADLLAKLKAK